MMSLIIKDLSHFEKRKNENKERGSHDRFHPAPLQKATLSYLINSPLPQEITKSLIAALRGKGYQNQK